MSAGKIISANYPIREVRPEADYPLEIDLNNGTTYDGDADDNFFIYPFPEVKDYADMEYGAVLDWAYYTRGHPGVG